MAKSIGVVEREVPGNCSILLARIFNAQILGRKTYYTEATESDLAMHFSAEYVRKLCRCDRCGKLCNGDAVANVVVKNSSLEQGRNYRVTMINCVRLC